MNNLGTDRMMDFLNRLIDGLLEIILMAGIVAITVLAMFII